MSLWSLLSVVFISVAVLYLMSTMKMSGSHQRAAMPLHNLIVLVFGGLALAAIGGGIYAIYRSAEADTKLDILGAHLSTGNVGVAFVGIGLFIAYFTVRAVLRNQRELAALPPERTRIKKVTKPIISIENKMPDLFKEIRTDLKDNPLCREFVLVKKSSSYWSKGHELVYYYEDHPELENKVRILENEGLIKDIKNNEVPRYVFTEKFVDELQGSQALE